MIQGLSFVYCAGDIVYETVFKAFKIKGYTFFVVSCCVQHP